jgi:hypothetical protein
MRTFKLFSAIVLVAAAASLAGCGAHDPNTAALGASFVPAPIRLLQEAGKSEQQKAKEAAECHQTAGAGTYMANYIPFAGHLIRYDNELKVAKANEACRNRKAAANAKPWVNPDSKRLAKR